MFAESIKEGFIYNGYRVLHHLDLTGSSWKTGRIVLDFQWRDQVRSRLKLIHLAW